VLVEDPAGLQQVDHGALGAFPPPLCAGTLAHEIPPLPSGGHYGKGQPYMEAGATSLTWWQSVSVIVQYCENTQYPSPAQCTRIKIYHTFRCIPKCQIIRDMLV
jgi:hypothetical protein